MRCSEAFTGGQGHGALVAMDSRATEGGVKNLEMVAGQGNDQGYFKSMKRGRSLQLYIQYTTGPSYNQS